MKCAKVRIIVTVVIVKGSRLARGVHINNIFFNAMTWRFRHPFFFFHCYQNDYAIDYLKNWNSKLTLRCTQKLYMQSCGADKQVITFLHLITSCSSRSSQSVEYILKRVLDIFVRLVLKNVIQLQLLIFADGQQKSIEMILKLSEIWPRVWSRTPAGSHYIIPTNVNINKWWVT